MANERTYLSWIRTSLTFITFGIAFLQFFRIDQKMVVIATDTTIDNTITKLSKPISIICILSGILCLIFGSFRYFQVQYYLIGFNYYPITRLSIIILLLINLSIVLLLLLLDFKITI